MTFLSQIFGHINRPSFVDLLSLSANLLFPVRFLCDTKRLGGNVVNGTMWGSDRREFMAKESGGCEEMLGCEPYTLWAQFWKKKVYEVRSGVGR